MRRRDGSLTRTCPGEAADLGATVRRRPAARQRGQMQRRVLAGDGRKRRMRANPCAGKQGIDESAERAGRGSQRWQKQSILGEDAQRAAEELHASATCGEESREREKRTLTLNFGSVYHVMNITCIHHEGSRSEYIYMYKY